MSSQFSLRRMALLCVATAAFAPSAFAANGPIDILVSVTGFYSCEDGASNPTELNKLGPLQRQIANGLVTTRQSQVALVTGCFDVRKLSFGHYTLNYMMRTRDVNGREKTYTLDLHALLSETSGDPAEFEEMLAMIETAIRDVAGESRARVHLWGHSYGGWIAMKIAERFPNTGIGAYSATLSTIDPISPVSCYPRSFIDSGVYTAPGCVHSPADVEVSEQQKILQAVNGQWLNFYESQFRHLHSGPIDALAASAHNLKVQLDSSNPVFNNYHKMIGEDERVWKRVQSQVLATEAAPTATVAFR